MFRARFVSLTEDARHHIRTALLAGPTADRSASPETAAPARFQAGSG